MITNSELHSPLPPDTPVPVDDGKASHLTGSMLPDLTLPVTSGRTLSLASLPYVSVLYFYPMTGVPGRAIPTGWESIPGARGCTLECRSFAAAHEDIVSTGASVFGISTQAVDELDEARTRLSLPFELMSDKAGNLTRALDLPTFNIEGKNYIRRLTLIVVDGRIEHCFYPVFPPHSHPQEVLSWLKNRNALQQPGVQNRNSL